MKIQPSVDQQLSDWLQVGPAEAPDLVLETVLAAVPSIPQRRSSHLPWTNGPRPFLRVMVGIAAAVAIVVGALVVISRLQPGSVGGLPATLPPGYTEITYKLMPAAGKQPDAAALATTTAVLDARVHSLGLTGAIVTARPPDEVVVLLPGGGDAEASRQVLGSTGLVEFVPLPSAIYGSTNTNAGGPTGVTTGQPLPTAEKPLFNNTAHMSAIVGTDQGVGSTIELTLSGEAVSLFADYTANHVGEFFAIVVDGIVFSAPAGQSAIPDGHVVITGGIGSNPHADLEGLVAILNSGPLPLPIQEIGARSGAAPGSTSAP